MEEDMRLTWKEREFLTECCYFNYKGGNLNKFSDLSKYMIGIRFFDNVNDCSIYKFKLSAKKWITSSRNKFKLPPDLDIKEGEEDRMNFTINLQYDGKEHNRKEDTRIQ